MVGTVSRLCPWFPSTYSTDDVKAVHVGEQAGRLYGPIRLGGVGRSCAEESTETLVLHAHDERGRGFLPRSRGRLGEGEGFRKGEFTPCQLCSPYVLCSPCRFPPPSSSARPSRPLPLSPGWGCRCVIRGCGRGRRGRWRRRSWKGWIGRRPSIRGSSRCRCEGRGGGLPGFGMSTTYL